MSIKGITYGTLLAAASSEWAPGFSSHFARVNYERNSAMNGTVTGGSSAWCAKTNDANQWISAASDTLKTFTAIQTQGRADTDCNQYVTSFTIDYSVDGVNFLSYNAGQIFPGNNDRNTIVTTTFPTPIVARVIVLKPKTWNEHISLRWDVLYQPIKQSLVNSDVVIGTNSALLQNNNPPRDRSQSYQITFKNPYPAGVIPNVVAQLKRLDFNEAHNQRAMVNVSNVTNTGCTITLMTWWDTILYSFDATYVAHAEF